MAVPQGEPDVGIDKQKILKGMLQTEKPEAAPTVSPLVEAPAVVPPPPSAPPRPSFWSHAIAHRAQIATLLLVAVGIVWLVVGLAGNEMAGYAIGGFFVGLGLISFLLSRRGD